MTNKGKKYKDRHNDKRRIKYYLLKMPKDKAVAFLKKIGLVK